MGYRIYQASPRDWDDLLRGFPERTVFHGTAWLNAVASAYGFKLILAAAADGDRTVGLWPCVEKYKGFLRILGSPLPGTSTPYLGPLFREGVDIDAVVRAFAADRTIGRHAFFACRTQDRERPVDLAAVGFAKLLRFETYLIDLAKPEQQLWASLKSQCRNRIRRAQKAGVEARLENGSEFLDDFWRMSVEVFAKTNIQPTYSRGFLEKAWTSLTARHRACALTAWFDGKRIAALVLPHDDHTMYAWAAASLGDYLRLAPNNLLHWEAIREGARRGLAVYDLVSAKGSGGRFKRTFGPDAAYVNTHWEHSRNVVIRLLRRAYEKRLRTRRRIHRRRRR